MFETIILIGPGTELFPIVNERLPKACLPIMNTPMILHTMRSLSGISSKFFVVGLNEERGQLMDAIGDGAGVPVEYVGIDTYDGTVASLLGAYPRVGGEDVLVCKGDIVTNMDVQAMAADYFGSKRMMMVIVGGGASETSLLGYRGDNLMFYSNDSCEAIPFELLRRGVTLTRDVDVLQLYMLKTSLLGMIKPHHFSFRQGALAEIVRSLGTENGVGIHRPGKSYIYQVRTIGSYLSANAMLKRHAVSTSKQATSESNARFIKEYVKKYNLKDLSNVIGEGTSTGDVLLLDSIVGRGCVVGGDSKIISSIVMDGVAIGNRVHVEGCIVGVGATIPEDSVLVGCRVPPGHVFAGRVSAHGQAFGK